MSSLKIIEGEKPKSLPSEYVARINLGHYELKHDLSAILNNKIKPFSNMTPNQQATLSYVTSLLNVKDKKNCLTMLNFTKMLDLLLFMEEHQMRRDIQNYDKSDQVLKPVKHSFLLELDIPGLAEYRPSLIRGDSVFVRESANSYPIYQGFVHKVQETNILLGFSRSFRDSVFMKNKKFYVSFNYNRFPLKVEHQAVHFTDIHDIAQFFFPLEVPKSHIKQQELHYFNKNIMSNPEQQQAISCILNRTAMPCPYLIFGPPGTGKTVTVVESIKQIHSTTTLNILVCAPSNNAANEIAKRLVDTIPTTDLLRYIAASFPFKEVPANVQRFVNHKNGDYFYPSLHNILKFRIVITTLITASRLVNGGIPPDHFNFVFIDESGHATESEILVPIAGILSSLHNPGHLTGQIVLAGDPKQLGPVVHSKMAIEYGFGMSMMERLMTTLRVYQKGSDQMYNACVLTKLVKNYRSHPVIVKQSNEMFYDNELECIGNDLINVALNWNQLPNPGFPFIFHSVIGVDQREKDSPSFFNMQEVNVVLKYLDKLLGTKLKGMKIIQEHIGIISPYKKQVEKLKQRCSERGLNNLTIGSVEQIQGQERLIIIISTVRSKPDYLTFDRKYHLGFLQNPKRLNVAITRAKALLIIIGNPNTLQYDEYWRKIIVYCQENGSVLGEQFKLTENPIEPSVLVNYSESNPSDELNMKSIDDAPNFSRGNI